jgi:hypothetical protein
VGLALAMPWKDAILPCDSILARRWCVGKQVMVSLMRPFERSRRLNTLLPNKKKKKKKKKKSITDRSIHYRSTEDPPPLTGRPRPGRRSLYDSVIGATGFLCGARADALTGQDVSRDYT